MKYFIVTGGSKGLGKAIIEELAQPEHVIFNISRSAEEPKLKNIVEEANGCYEGISFDLTDSLKIEALMQTIFEKIDLSRAEQVVLINNAGGVEPISAYQNAEDEAVLKNIALNLTAPMLLSRHFGKNVSHFKGDRRIITISSGAGKRPLFGWHSYCVTKAGVDMMTRVIGLEEGDEGIKAVSFGPGIMDTDMQATIRSSNEADFKDLQMFKDFKANGKLLSAEEVAKIVLKLIYEPFEQGALLSVSDYQEK